VTRSLLRNISWLGLTSLAVKPVWFLFITAACIRVLGADGYGIFTATLALGMMAAAFTDVGMVRYSIREIARDHSQASRYFTNFMLLRTGLSVVAGAIGLIAGWMLNYRGDTLWALLFATLYALVLNITNYCTAIYQAFEDLRLASLMLIAEKTLVIGFGLAFLLTMKTAHWTLAGMTTGILLTTGTHILLIDRRFAPIRRALFDVDFLVSRVRVLIPFGLAGLFILLYFRLDMVMVESMLGQVAAGQYGVAFRIQEALNMLPSLVALAAVYPRLSRLREAGQTHSFGHLVRMSLLGLGGASLIIALTMTFGAPLIIRLLAPDAVFAPSVQALQILSWTFPFLCLNYVLYVSLVTANDERFLAVVLGFVVLFNLTANLIAIPAFGIYGAAATTVASEVILLTIYVVRYRRVFSSSSVDSPSTET
jgi:O-antigen/teichoic acid export membrane protein